jgi:multicomponent Na+:H+ antiporter subunit E
MENILESSQKAKIGFQRFVVTFPILFIFWLILSGKFDTFHISLGICCSLIVAYIGHNLLFANVRAGDMKVVSKRIISYIPWLLYQILVSNFHVAYLALSPKMPIDPKIIRFKTKLESDMSMVALANSITLTPGTITMDIEEREFIVHALSKKVADDLNTGEMEDRIAHIFMEADHIYVQDVLDMTRIFGELEKRNL